VKEKCPRCKNYEEVNVLQETKAEETLDGIGHLHLECKTCGWQFNQWIANKEAIKKVYKDSYDLYK
jgi:hypothetical protein